MTVKNFFFPKGSFGFGQKVLQEFLTQEPKKIMLLGPGTDSLAKSVAAYAGIPEVGLLQVRRTQRFITLSWYLLITVVINSGTCVFVIF